jgi:hypothetical protein
MDKTESSLTEEQQEELKKMFLCQFNNCEVKTLAEFPNEVFWVDKDTKLWMFNYENKFLGDIFVRNSYYSLLKTKFNLPENNLPENQIAIILEPLLTDILINNITADKIIFYVNAGVESILRRKRVYPVSFIKPYKHSNAFEIKGWLTPEQLTDAIDYLFKKKLQL